MRKPKFEYLCVYLLSSFLIVTGLIKMLSFADFANAIIKYDLVPYEWTIIIAYSVIAFEIILGVALLLSGLREYIIFFTTVLISGFLALSVYTRVNMLDIDCGCFGNYSGRAGSEGHIIILLLLLSQSLFVSSKLKKNYNVGEGKNEKGI